VLEIRLKELWNTVDYFVITESNLSHSGKPKDYIFENNMKRFAPYMSKIRHIKVADMPETSDSWVRERFQRAAGQRGLYDLRPEDIVITSDCDEISRADIIELIKEDENDYDRYILYVAQFSYKINYMKIQNPSRHPVIIATRGRVFTNPQQEREYSFFWNAKPENTIGVDHGGWHFTYFGDEQHCVNKIQNFAHTEQNKPSVIDEFNIEWMIRNKYGHEGIESEHNERFEYVVIDEYFPKCITNNLDYWKNMIIPNAVFRVEDLYRTNEKN